MKNLTMDVLIRETKDILKRRGKIIYFVQLILTVFSVKTTYQLYSIYPDKVSSAYVSGYFSTIIELIISAILTIFMIMIINNGYEKIDVNYKQVLTNSIRKLPRYVLGFLIMGGILILSFIIIFITTFLFRYILVIQYIGILLHVIALLYIMMRFSLIMYIMILESGTSLIKRCQEFYKLDKSLIIKYFIIIISIGIIPALFLTLPERLGIEFSKNAFLLTRLLVNLFHFILLPISYVLGLLIYKQYTGRHNE